MTSANRDAAQAGLFSDEETKFLIGTEAEISHILRNMLQKAELLTASFDDGKECANTSILEVHPESDEMIFDTREGGDILRKLLASPNIVFETHQNGVMIKFAVTGAREARFGGRPALVAEIPRALVRLQRREYYRVPGSFSKPIKCTIPIEADGIKSNARVMAVDISLGGVAVMDQHRQINFRPGAIHKNCSVELPETGIVTADLEIRTCYEMTLKNGAVCTRAGCKFLNLSPRVLNLLQRFVMKLERDGNRRVGRP